MSPPNYWKKLYRYVGLAMVLLVLIGAALAFLPKIQQFQGYKETKTGLEKEIRTEKSRIKDLREKQQKFTTDKNFVQRLAHEKGFAHENETIYQLEEPAETNGLNIETRAK